jgi:hypothetical protein
VVGGDVGDREVAAGGQAVGDARDDAPGVVRVGDEVQHRDQQDRDRLGEVDDLADGRAGQQVPGEPDVRLDDRDRR